MLDLALDTRIFIDDPLDAAIQELDILFNTENTELIGYPEYGTNWLQFLWQLDPSPADLQKYIYEKIADTFFVSQLEINVDVNSIEDNTGDLMYIVHIDLSNGEVTKSKNYKLY